MFLALEWENGSQQYEEIESTDIGEAIEIAKNALEDAPTVYILQGYQDEKYGWQPATHLDYVYRVTRLEKG
jgi:hypothetical protein